MSEEYSESDFTEELQRFVNGRLFAHIEGKLMDSYKDVLSQISADEPALLVAQKRKIEALNDLIESMRSHINQQSLEELNNGK